jgi:hypothetical protein
MPTLQMKATMLPAARIDLLPRKRPYKTRMLGCRGLTPSHMAPPAADADENGDLQRVAVEAIFREILTLTPVNVGALSCTLHHQMSDFKVVRLLP